MSLGTGLLYLVASDLTAGAAPLWAQQRQATDHPSRAHIIHVISPHV